MHVGSCMIIWQDKAALSRHKLNSSLPLTPRYHPPIHPPPLIVIETPMQQESTCWTCITIFTFLFSFLFPSFSFHLNTTKFKYYLNELLLNISWIILNALYATSQERNVFAWNPCLISHNPHESLLTYHENLFKPSKCIRSAFPSGLLFIYCFDRLNQEEVTRFTCILNRSINHYPFKHKFSPRFKAFHLFRLVNWLNEWEEEKLKTVC